MQDGGEIMGHGFKGNASDVYSLQGGRCRARQTLELAAWSSTKPQYPTATIVLEPQPGILKKYIRASIAATCNFL